MLRLLAAIALACAFACSAHAQTEFTTPNGRTTVGTVQMCVNAAGLSVPCSAAAPLSTLAPLSSGLAAPAAKIVTPGTQVPFSGTSVPLKFGFLVQANPNNTSPVKVGLCGQVDNNMTGAGNGKVLVPGQSWTFGVPDLNLLCLQGITAGDWADGTGSTAN